MLEKFKFFKDKDKKKGGVRAATKTTGSASRSKDGADAGAPADVDTGASASLRRKGKSVTSHRDHGDAGTHAPVVGSAQRRALGVQHTSGQSDSSLKETGSRSGSRLAASSLPKTRTSVASSSCSSVTSATPTSSLPKPASSKSKTKAAIRDGVSAHGQPARRSASMSATTGAPRALPQPQPGQRIPSGGMPLSRPPTAHISFLSQVNHLPSKLHALYNISIE